MAIAGDQDLFGSPFNVGDYVNVRCLVNSLTGRGAGGTVNLTVDTPGNVGEVAGVTFNVSPVQCRRSQGAPH
jgi:hypothetical protein